MGRDEEGPSYETMLLLLEQPLADALIDGCMSLRMQYKLGCQTDFAADAVSDRPEFENRVPRPSSDLECDLCWWEYIPQEVRGAEVYKSFAYGWCMVIEAVHAVLQRQKRLPTLQRVIMELQGGGYSYDMRMIDKALLR